MIEFADCCFRWSSTCLVFNLDHYQLERGTFPTKGKNRLEVALCFLVFAWWSDENKMWSCLLGGWRDLCSKYCSLLSFFFLIMPRNLWISKSPLTWRVERHNLATLCQQFKTSAKMALNEIIFVPAISMTNKFQAT